MYVIDLVKAWYHAIGYVQPAPLTSTFIKELGALAKPGVNAHGFRTYPIRIGYDVRSNHHDIERQVNSLCELYNEGRLTPDDLYYEYEYIHPFGDGNGRTGKILFNWANGTLLDPQMPEDRHGWAIQ